jgi:hypothetical protein
MKQLAPNNFETYLRANAAKREYLLPNGRRFKFQVHDRIDKSFPCSIEFSCKQWSPNTVRIAGADRVSEFLKIFNENPHAPLSRYRNRKGKGSPAWVATYLTILMRDATQS